MNQLMKYLIIFIFFSLPIFIVFIAEKYPSQRFIDIPEAHFLTSIAQDHITSNITIYKYHDKSENTTVYVSSNGNIAVIRTPSVIKEHNIPTNNDLIHPIVRH